jgi:AcrR family transcriptional regulator
MIMLSILGSVSFPVGGDRASVSSLVTACRATSSPLLAMTQTYHWYLNLSRVSQCIDSRVSGPGRVRWLFVTEGAPHSGDNRPASADAGHGDVLWLRGAAQRAPRRAAPLTQERIVAAAVDELDEYGAERLTMRRLAQRLKVTSTALYWHVKTKEDLLDLAVDHIVGEVPLPEPVTDPRSALRAMLVGWRAAMLAHPWSPALLGRPMLGPGVLARTEFLQSMLTRAGVSGFELASSTRILADFVIGTAMSDATWQRWDDPDILAKAQAHIVGMREQYPTLSTSGFTERAWTDDNLFQFSLDRILDMLMAARE